MSFSFGGKIVFSPNQIYHMENSPCELIMRITSKGRVERNDSWKRVGKDGQEIVKQLQFWD